MKDVITHRKLNKRSQGARNAALTREKERRESQNYAKIGEQSVATWAEKKSASLRTAEHETMCTALSRCIAVRPCVDTCIKVRASVSERDDPSTSNLQLGVPTDDITATIVMHHTEIRS